MTEHHSPILAVLADLPRAAAAPAVESGELASRLSRLVALHDASVAIVSSSDPAEICRALIAELEALLPYERSLVATLGENAEVTVLAHAGRNGVESDSERERITELIRRHPHAGVIRWVIANGLPLRIDDTRADGRYLTGDPQIRAELCVPMRYGTEVIGAINVESREPGAFSEVDQAILAAVASTTAVALQNARLHQSLVRELAVRQRTEAALSESERRYRTLVLTAGEGIVVLVEGAVTFANPRARTLLGPAPPGGASEQFLTHVERAARGAVRRALAGTGTSAEPVQLGTLALVDADGQPARWVTVTASQIDWDGGPAVLGFLSDVTETHKLTRRLRHQASHDALTGLVNRHEFEARLIRAIDAAQSGHAQHVMGYLDLDQFKVINDSCGHAAGDELLGLLAQSLPRALRTRDTLARLGGDEFGILLEHCGIEEACAVAAKLAGTVESLRFAWGEREYRIGVSIGLVGIDSAQTSVSEVLRAADVACYAAKAAGRGRIRVYRDDDDDLTRRSAEMRILADVRDALDAQRIELFFQPIRSLGDAPEHQNIEILSRLRMPDGALLSPAAFLPAVERYGLASALDSYVVERVTAWLRRHPRQAARFGYWSINLSASSLGDAGLLDTIVRAVAHGDPPGHKLCFEITETAAMVDMQASLTFIGTLRGHGCHFALDDFGAGLSSFAYLRDLDVDFLKIDGSFIKNLPDDETNMALVSAMAGLARTLGLESVAEFVATPQILDAVSQIGIDYAQGYAIAEPLPVAGLTDGHAAPTPR